MIEGGWALHNKDYSNDAILAQAEANARKAKAGLWSDPRPVAPWDFQKRESLYKPSDPNTFRNEIIKLMNDLETVPINQVLPSGFDALHDVVVGRFDLERGVPDAETGIEQPRRGPQ